MRVMLAFIDLRWSSPNQGSNVEPLKLRSRSYRVRIGHEFVCGNFPLREAGTRHWTVRLPANRGLVSQRPWSISSFLAEWYFPCSHRIVRATARVVRELITGNHTTVIRTVL